MKRMRKIISIAVCICFCFTCRANEDQTPVAHKGIIDLRKSDLFGKSLSVSGEWAFYWRRLLTPDSLSSTSATPDYVPFPLLWNKLRLQDPKVSPTGYATYTLTVLLPAKRPRIGIEVPDAYCSLKLYVNGIVQAQNGEPATEKDSARPFWATRTIAVPPGESDTLVLVMQIANFWHARGGPYKEMLVGDKDELFLKKNRDAAYDFMLGGCLFMGGLFFLALFVFGRNDRTILYFALFCIVYSYRMVGTSHYALHALFNDLNWFVTVRLEYLTLSIGIILFTLYTKNLYPEDSHPLIMNGLIWFCLFYTAMVLFTPTLVFTSFLVYFLAAMFFCIAYANFVYLRAARNRRSGSVFAVLSACVMLFIFLVGNLHYFGLIPEMRGILFISYIAFFFLQSLTLSHRFAETFRQATFLAQQGLRAKSDFLSTMSHEIRTPLNAVIGMTHLLLHNKPRTDQEEDLGVLLFSANNLLSIVNNILDYTKIEEGKINFERIPMDLSAIAGNIIAGLKNAADEKGISLLVEVDDRLDRLVMGDPTRTSQVITNLVHNAIKFTKEGFVKLSVSTDQFLPDSVSVTISVQDTGIGIPKEKQDMIFDRFTQADSSISRSYGGTGLGLAISKKILGLQGVILQLQSESNKGSRFYFKQTFLLCDDQKMETGKLPAMAGREPFLQNVSILLVEDNPLNVLVAQTILENNGARVEVAANGEEALELLDATRHQLVLMDLHMPVMDGYQATALLRQRGETLPIIALTASTPKEVEGDAYSAGLNGVVVKPFSPEELYRVILQHLPR